MLTRRQFVFGAALGAAAPALVACSSKADYEQAAHTIWRHGPAPSGDRAAVLRELVRHATLAPSSHNTQCWKFLLKERSIIIQPDLLRRCPVVDPDDHHLFVSLGCAAENLAQAALAAGLRADASFEATGNGAIAVDLQPTRAVVSPLFAAIPNRQSTRGDYNGKPLAGHELRLLEQAGNGTGVRVMLMTERRAMETALEYVVAGNTAQMNDPAFVDELKQWIRFSRDEAMRKGDGLSAVSSGNPSLPRWLGSRMMEMVFTPGSENERYSRQIRNSAGIAVFVSEANDKAHWVEAGRCYQRFALQATALGIRNAFLNQPVEVATVRPQFASWLGVGGLRPDLVVRFGRGPTLPPSLRRPVEDVLL